MRVDQWCSCRPVCTLRHSPQWWLRSHELRDSQFWPCSRPEVKLKMVWIDFYFIAKNIFYYRIYVHMLQFFIFKFSMKTCLALNSQSSSRRVSEVLLPGLTDQSQISLVCNEKYFLGLKLWNFFTISGALVRGRFLLVWPHGPAPARHWAPEQKSLSSLVFVESSLGRLLVGRLAVGGWWVISGIEIISWPKYIGMTWSMVGFWKLATTVHSSGIEKKKLWNEMTQLVYSSPSWFFMALGPL